MQADIIIPVWNHLDDLTKRVIASVRGNTAIPYQLIVVNDGSTDGTAEWLASQDALIIVTNKINQGWASATNRGLKISTAPYVVLLNNDVQVSENWLGLLIKGLETHPDVGIIIPADIAPVRANPGPDGVAIQKQPPGYSCVVLRREVIQDMGLLDEYMGSHADADYSYRMKLAGWKFALHHHVRATHDGNVTVKDRGDEGLREYVELGKQRLREKWPGVSFWGPMAWE